MVGTFGNWKTLAAAATIGLAAAVAGQAQAGGFTEEELADIKARNETAQTVTPSAPTWPNGGTYVTTKTERQCPERGGTWPIGGCTQPALGLGHAQAETWPAGGY